MTSEQEQLGLFRDSGWQRFERWVHSPEGREVANRFMRIASALHKQGVRMGAMAIWERIRWNIEIKNRDRGARYKLNNNYRSYMARFAMERNESLRGYFEVRKAPRKAQRAVVIPIAEKPVNKG